MATYSSVNNSWQQLYTKGNNMKLPERELLTKDGVYMKRRPEPEVVEHMLDDLETKMRNYFILYNREREFRKKSEENCYRLEQELLNYKQQLDESNNKFYCLERKVKSMVDQPLKLKETIDRIELLYNQMDMLIQAFVGIGSCAVIQGYSRVAFIKLCLEYLYPCRELDIRLNTLYNALYNVLTQYDGIEVTQNEIMKPMTFHDAPEKTNLTGISVKVHRLMLKCDLPETKSFGCFFRYDHEPKELRTTDYSRFISTEVKPMDNASKVYEFNSLIQNNTLPPKVPNVIPKLVLDVYSDALYVGSAEVSLISEKTLKPCEPWNILDSNGMHCGDVVVTVVPMPKNANLPAVKFANKADELVNETKTTVEPEKPASVNATSENVQAVKPNFETKPADAKTEPAKPFEPRSEPNKPFQPKAGSAVRKPLFSPKTTPAAKSAQNKPQAKGSSSNVSRLSMMFSRKKNQGGEEASAAPETNATPEPAATEAPPKTEGTTTATPATNVENANTNQPDTTEVPKADSVLNQITRQKTTIKDAIIKKLSTKHVQGESVNEEPKAEVNNTGAATNNAEKAVLSKSNTAEVGTKKEEKAEPPNAVTTQQTGPASPEPTQTAPIETVARAPTMKAMPPPEPLKKVVPKLPPSQPAAGNQNTAGEKLPEKPLLTVAITPKLLKKPSPPKRT